MIFCRARQTQTTGPDFLSEIVLYNLSRSHDIGADYDTSMENMGMRNATLCHAQNEYSQQPGSGCKGFYIYFAIDIFKCSYCLYMIGGRRVKQLPMERTLFTLVSLVNPTRRFSGECVVRHDLARVPTQVLYNISMSTTPLVWNSTGKMQQNFNFYSHVFGECFLSAVRQKQTQILHLFLKNHVGCCVHHSC